MCVCVHAFICAHVYREAFPCAEAREAHWFLPLLISTLFLWNKMLLNLKFAISARLADQLAFGIHLYPSPRAGLTNIYSHTWPFFFFFLSFFPWVLEIWIQALRLTQELLLLTKPSPALSNNVHSFPKQLYLVGCGQSIPQSYLLISKLSWNHYLRCLHCDVLFISTLSFSVATWKPNGSAEVGGVLSAYNRQESRGTGLTEVVPWPNLSASSWKSLK